jgi:hypothetical protein
MWTSITQVVTALVSVISLTWVIVTQVRRSSGRKHAALAETALRLLAGLESIGVGGISSRLDDRMVQEVHAAQIHGLHELIRINTAEFERRAKRPGVPIEVHLLVGTYGILILAIAFGLMDGVRRMRLDQQWLGDLIVVGVSLLGIALVVDVVVAVSRRLTARGVRRRAGQYVPSALEIVSSRVVALWRCRQQRRDRGAAVQPALSPTGS